MSKKKHDFNFFHDKKTESIREMPKNSELIVRVDSAGEMFFQEHLKKPLKNNYNFWFRMVINFWFIRLGPKNTHINMSI